jgi:hypothetical protein
VALNIDNLVLMIVSDHLFNSDTYRSYIFVVITAQLDYKRLGGNRIDLETNK